MIIFYRYFLRFTLVSFLSNLFIFFLSLDGSNLFQTEQGVEGFARGYGTCGDRNVAELAAAKVVELEGEEELAYIMMSNIYAACQRGDEAAKCEERGWL